MSLFKTLRKERFFTPWIKRPFGNELCFQSSGTPYDWTRFNPVALKYLSFSPNGSESPSPKESHNPIVICHGMLGSAQNWSSLARIIGNQTKRTVIVPDLRNHGQSPKVGPITYHHLAADLWRLCQDLNLKDVTLIGHSLGGRTAMLLALLDPTCIKQ